MKYKFNIEPIIIEADSEQEAWTIYENADWVYDVRLIEEIK